VQAQTLALARAAVERAGGHVTNELDIIQAVGTQLTAEQARALRATAGVTVFADTPVKTMGGLDAYAIPMLRVDRRHAQGINGAGVTVGAMTDNYTPANAKDDA
jgi:hypothetical protein